MADNSNTFPQTWDELTRDALYQGMPDMTRPKDLSVAQSAMLAVTQTRVDERVVKLDKAGAFDRNAKTDLTEAAILVAETVQYADMFLTDVAKDPRKWREWTRGRSAVTLFTIMGGLIRFYTEALGKSDASKLPSVNAA